MSEEIMDPMMEAAADKIFPYKEIIAALIASAASIRNTDCITRAMYAQIDAQLKICKDYINENRSQFFARMKEREYILNAYRDMFDSLKNPLLQASGESAFHCTKLMETIVLQMSEIGTSGPEIIKPTCF